MTKSIALILIASGLGSGIASAEPVTVYASNAPTATVSYADLDLKSDHGIARLQTRVRSAASGLCLEPTREPLPFSTARTMCFRTAVGNGFAQIDRVVADQLAGKTSLTAAIVFSAR